MKTKILLLLLFIPFTLLGDHMVRDGVISTSLVRVVSNPEAYDGKRILLKGFLRRGFEQSGLYLSREDAAILNTKQALWVGSVRKGRENIEFPEEEFVMIVGTLSFEEGKGFGHRGLWLAEITEIEQVLKISADR
ncbi:MAG: hypothetical protein JJT75_00730 [Opitutales bacterium]|nr:hypothetical protein [Opitutales bacterium]MCH8539916.1 hypothetical protein [Opitutales bacterium]